MLLKMLPEQVVDRWELFKEGIEENLPSEAGETPDKMNKILEALLIGDMQCWISFRNNSDDTKSGIGLILTTTLEDRFAGTRSLMIYLIWAWEKTRASDWIEGFQALMKFAKLMKCSSIIGYTHNEKIAKIAKRLGGSLQTFITIPYVN